MEREGGVYHEKEDDLSMAADVAAQDKP